MTARMSSPYQAKRPKPQFTDTQIGVILIPKIVFKHGTDGMYHGFEMLQHLPILSKPWDALLLTFPFLKPFYRLAGVIPRAGSISATLN